MNQYRRTSMSNFGLFGIAVFSWILGGCVFAGKYPEPLYSKDGHDISFYRPPESNLSFPNPTETPLRNIILCIGDGMGVNQVALARYRGIGAAGRLWMERLPTGGLVCTYNADGRVTDSAAAITAMACGVKTRNGMIGQGPDGTGWMTIAERLREKGYRVGVVVTCTITHATPAGMAAHVPKRALETEIAVQIFDAGFDVLFGGGRKYWLPESIAGGVRKDRRNLLAQAEQTGYQIVQNRRQMEAVLTSRVIGLFQEDALTTVAPEPTLAEMTRAALRLLTAGPPDRSGPFILLVEGSQIDWACHINNENACVRQTLLFDMAVREVLEFAFGDQHTLVLVTADHETGGMVLIDGDNKNDGLKVEWTSKDHTAAPVPLFAYGPGAERFGGVLDNTEISVRITRLLGIEDFPCPLPQSLVEPDEEKVYEMSH